MTDVDWYACNDPEPMINMLSVEKFQWEFRQFAVACARRVWHLLPVTAQSAVDAQERFIAGNLSAIEADDLLQSADREAKLYYAGGRSPDARAYAEAAIGVSPARPVTPAQLISVSSCAASAIACAVAATQIEDQYDRVYDVTMKSELAAQAELLRRIVKSPPE